jgi:hypothetical protein
MSEVKVTKKQYFEQIKEIALSADASEDVIAFIDHEIELLNGKAAKAAERAAEKKAAGDELRAQVLAVVTNEFQNADEITAQIDVEGVTKAKVVNRLSQLVEMESVVKETAKSEDGRRLMVYKLA